MFLLVFGIVWLPIPAGFRLFASPTKTIGYLQALWQVEGATLAISLAVVIFVFQAVYASRLGGSLRHFAEETFLFPIFFSGVYAIGLVGFVLLGGGYGAPGGWAATWATVVGALVGVLLIFLFVSTIRAIEPKALHTRRLERARREIERETERIILQRIATNILSQVCDEAGIEFIPTFGTAPPAPAVAIKATRAGEVSDVRLLLLRRVGARARELGLGKPRLRIYPDLAVNESFEVLWADPSALAAVRHPKRIVRTRERRSERAFSETIQRLHDEATRLLVDPMPGAYGDILEVYEDMIVTLPKTWAEYGQDYSPNVAGSISIFERDFLDILERDLYDEMRSAVLGSNREIAHDALHFPVGIAYRAVDFRASALSGRMLALLAHVLAILIRSPANEARQDLLEGIVLSLESYGSYRVEPLITDAESDEASRDFGRVVMLQLYETVAEICKRTLDADPTATQIVGRFNGIYERFFRYWEPQHEQPFRFELDHAVQTGADEAAVEVLRSAVERKEAEVALHDELDDARLVQRLGLMFWVLRRVRSTGSPDWIAAWPEFANYLGDITTLARVTDKAIEYAYRERGRWSNWILETLPTGEAHAIGVDGELIDAFIVRALQLIDPDQPAPEIAPMEWMPGRLDEPTARIKAVTDVPRFAPLLPVDRLVDRISLLAAALEASNQARKDREDQKVIDAPLDQERIDAFQVGLRSAFESGRWLHRALLASGATEAIEEEPAESVSGSEINRLFPKDLFIEDARVVGGEMIAHQNGASLAAHERDAYLTQLIVAPVTSSNANAPLVDQLRVLVADLRADGYEPSLVVSPSGWTTLQSLQLVMYRGHGGTLEPPAWVESADGHGELAGSFDEIPTFQVHRGQADRILVVDLARFALWRDWVPRGETVEFVEFKSYNDVEAEQLAREQPSLFEGDVADRTKRIRMSVWIRAGTRYEIEVRDTGAIRALEVPEGLR